MTYIQLSDCIFGGDPRRFSQMFRFVVCHLYNNFRHKIMGKSLSMWLPHNVDIFIESVFKRLENSAVERRTTDADGNVQRTIFHDLFDRANARIFAFIDDIAMGCARPGASSQYHFYR